MNNRRRRRGSGTPSVIGPVQIRRKARAERQLDERNGRHERQQPGRAADRAQRGRWHPGRGAPRAARASRRSAIAQEPEMPAGVVQREEPVMNLRRHQRRRRSLEVNRPGTASTSRRKSDGSARSCSRSMESSTIVAEEQRDEQTAAPAREDRRPSACCAARNQLPTPARRKSSGIDHWCTKKDVHARAERRLTIPDAALEIESKMCAT